MTVVAITGHRPEKIPDFNWVRKALTDLLIQEKPKKLIQGMAAGVDLLSAEVAHTLNIPFVSAKPWAGHASRNSDRELYQFALDNAVEVVNVHPAMGYLGPWMYQSRNEYMVDRADILIAVWDGTSGGTGNCVKYAKKKKVPIIIIDPLEKTVVSPGRQLPEPEAAFEQVFLFDL